MKLVIVSIMAAASLFVAGTASAFSTGPCKACHAIGKDGPAAPDWAAIAKAYGSEKALAEVFKAGFKVEDRKYAATSAKWKGQAALMTGQYTSLIKGHEDEAAQALFDAVKAGKF